MLRGVLATLSLLVVIVAVGCPITLPGPTYFLVADPSNPDLGSYVLPLTDESDIAHAREVIADPDNTDGHIIVAKIAKGGTSHAYVNGVYANRDLLNKGALWSWHVSEFLAFADVVIEIYDGWPQYVEDNLDEWLTTTGNTIGFWSFRVTREVGLDEMS